ncbi:hypothetical protein COY27_06195 [Candidatus Woesearchaeota archaeon CG_4_10_14_0_2_um_filter_33_13]|nr:MAG: hypothetical protein COY27_06195 [Candidatus Woesearchaeota archaeon CG_4_10_14_0_2_um_filter_33_13]
MDEDRVAPVKEGEQYEVYINSVGGKGDGIAKIKGFVLFVPNTEKGDYVKVKITKVLKTAGFAEVVQKLERPVKVNKFATVTQEEFTSAPEEQYREEIADSEDFGEELEEE